MLAGFLERNWQAELSIYMEMQRIQCNQMVWEMMNKVGELIPPNFIPC